MSEVNGIATEKRTELHLLTEMSDYNGVSGIREILDKADGWEDIGALAITDINSVQAFPDAGRCQEKHAIKLIYGMTATVNRSGEEAPCMLLAKNAEGKHNLFRLVTEAYKKENEGRPAIEWDYLLDHRGGLLIGASCEGEVADAVIRGLPDDDVRMLIARYDYVEIHPRANMQNMCSEEEAGEVIRRIASLAEQEGRPVAAVSNAAFIYPDDQICHEVLTDMDPHGKIDRRPLYIRSTSEMLEEFAFLGEEKSLEVVLENPNRISAECGTFDPISDRKYPLHFPDEEAELKKICCKAASGRYGDPLPDIVERRLRSELESICKNGFAGIYLFWKLLTDKSRELGYATGSRGSAGASFVAFLCGITDVNPLEAHYYCPECHRFEVFSKDPGDYWYTGYDIPAKSCPECGAAMERDGFNIPFELIAGLKYDKEPDIDLNFSSDIQDKIIQYAEECFGEENVIRAGTIATVPEKTAALKLYEHAEKTGNNEYAAFFRAKQDVLHNFDDYGLIYDHNGDFSGIGVNEFKNRYREWEREEEELVKKVSGTKRGMGVHPGGIIVVPGGTDISEITPVEYKRMADKEVKITHFDYHAVDGCVTKFDILGHDLPNMLHILEVKTGFRQDDIPYDDEKVLSLFRGAEAFGFEDRRLNGVSYFGTLGIPEFSSVFSWELLASADVGCFSDLMRISALQHGAYSWTDNAENLVSDGRKLKDVVSYRDDIMLYLESIGMDHEDAFRIMENVRKGKKRWHPEDEDTEKMREIGVPEWYIDSCNKIGYLFPKAHTASYVKQAWKMAYYKLYYPEAFYQTVFCFKMIPGEIERDPGRLDSLIIRLKDDDELSQNGREELRTLYLLAEARDRGYDIRRMLEEWR